MASPKETIRQEEDTGKLRSSELVTSSIVVTTDLEGPHLLGDTALNTMSMYVRPKNGNGIDYGAILFGETYNWFEENFDTRGFGQEGSDIVLTMPPLLRCGVTEEMLLTEARMSKRTPGSDTYVSYLKNKGAVNIGVTTAWEEPHREIVLNKIGLDGIFGTDFPIDQARQTLFESGKWEEEMSLTEAFLRKSFTIIEQIESFEGEERKIATEQLKRLIGQFYVGTLGVSWNDRGKQIVMGKGTELARIMAKFDVIGDKRKAEVAHSLFARHGRNGAVNIAIGDGFNDRRMLGQSPWSIGINGADAARAAKIGIVASDVGRPLVVVTELIQRNPIPSFANIQTIINDANKVLGDGVIVHKGGLDTPADLIAKHKAMKREIRGNGALIP